MAIDLLNLEPVKASTDLSSYTSFIYGVPKSGKTTFVHDLYKDRVLFIATERRHKVLVGANVQYISSWMEYLTILSQLRNPQLKEKFDVICIDTVENLYRMLENYVLAKYGKTEFGQVPWGKDYIDVKNFWVDNLQMIEKLGYSPCFISHATQKTEQIPVSAILKEDVNDTMTLVEGKEGEESYYEFLKYVPDLKDKVMAPINKMVDNILFLNLTTNEKMEERRVIFLRDTLQWQAGSTFKDIRPVIELSAEAYKEAIEEAISKLDPSMTTEERAEIGVKEDDVDFDELMAEAKEIAVKFHGLNRMNEVERIVDEVFGPGKKLTEATKEQVQLLFVAVQRMKEAL